MNNTKEKKAKLQIIIAVLMLTAMIFVEMYFMINFAYDYVLIIIPAIIALVDVYVLVNAIITISTEKEIIRNEHFENLYRSEKASYIMLKKSFDEIEDRLNEIQEVSKIPTEEIINAQKGIAKVIINRSKENADAIINSNDQVLERLDEVEETQNTKFTSLSKEQRLKLTDIGTQTDMKMQDLMMQLKDTEVRLNHAIASGSKVVMQAAPAYMPQTMQVPPMEVPSVEIPPVSSKPVESPVMEAIVPEVELTEMDLSELDLPEMEEVENIEEVLVDSLLEETEQMFEEENLFSEDNFSLEEEPIFEEVEETPPMPDLSDPNKQMSPDDIAALFANLEGAVEPVEEPAPVEKVVEAEEKPPMPDLSDPNKVMSPDDIAALIANL